MATERKVETVKEVGEKLTRASALVITDYRGLTVAEMQDLRRKLRSAQIDYLVVKNTLARRAAAENGLEALEAELVGPVGLAIGYDEPITPARLVNEYNRMARKLVIKGGLLGRQLLDADTVKRLAELPGREALLGQLAGTLNHSVAQLAGAMQGAITKLANGLDAYRRKLEASGGTDSAAGAAAPTEPAPAETVSEGAAAPEAVAEPAAEAETAEVAAEPAPEAEAVEVAAVAAQSVAEGEPARPPATPDAETEPPTAANGGSEDGEDNA